VRTPDGTWADVPYVPGSFAVNSGDMMKRWTNHRFKSTPHRALPPVDQPRYAIPYFLGPHLDTEIPRGFAITDTIRIERVGMVLFYEAGTVAESLEELPASRVHTSYGVGLRFSLERTAVFRRVRLFS
jgi:hypothetical protein